ncbi:hypothetical protein CDIK_2953 [Cucumispora dikerogammari]|nr:hypothetical protein CDIK_2953 [Cucumispora dikerogammari]
MSINNAIFQTINLSFNYMLKTLQCDKRLYKYRRELPKNILITSNNLNDLCRVENPDYVKLSDFKLKANKDGNSFLFPTFELRDEKGQPIKEEEGLAFECNKLSLLNNSILFNSYGFFGCLQTKVNDLTISVPVKPNGLFLFNNPHTDTIYIFVLATLCDKKEKLTVEKKQLNISGLLITNFYFFFGGLGPFPSLILRDVRRENNTSYALVYAEGLKNTIFAFRIKNNDIFETFDTNFEDKHFAIDLNRSENKFNSINAPLLNGKENVETDRHRREFKEVDESSREKEQYLMDNKTQEKSRGGAGRRKKRKNRTFRQQLNIVDESLESPGKQAVLPPRSKKEKHRIFKKTEVEKSLNSERAVEQTREVKFEFNHTKTEFGEQTTKNEQKGIPTEYDGQKTITRNMVSETVKEDKCEDQIIKNKSEEQPASNVCRKDSLKNKQKDEPLSKERRNKRTTDEHKSQMRADIDIYQSIQNDHVKQLTTDVKALTIFQDIEEVSIYLDKEQLLQTVDEKQVLQVGTKEELNSKDIKQKQFINETRQQKLVKTISKANSDDQTYKTENIPVTDNKGFEDLHVSFDNETINQQTPLCQKLFVSDEYEEHSDTRNEQHSLYLGEQVLRRKIEKNNIIEAPDQYDIEPKRVSPTGENFIDQKRVKYSILLEEKTSSGIVEPNPGATLAKDNVLITGLEEEKEITISGKRCQSHAQFIKTEDKLITPVGLSPKKLVLLAEPLNTVEKNRTKAAHEGDLLRTESDAIMLKGECKVDKYLGKQPELVSEELGVRVQKVNIDQTITKVNAEQPRVQEIRKENEKENSNKAVGPANTLEGSYLKNEVQNKEHYEHDCRDKKQENQHVNKSPSRKGAVLFLLVFLILVFVGLLIVCLLLYLFFSNKNI